MIFLDAISVSGDDDGFIVEHTIDRQAMPTAFETAAQHTGWTGPCFLSTETFFRICNGVITATSRDDKRGPSGFAIFGIGITAVITGTTTSRKKGSVTISWLGYRKGIVGMLTIKSRLAVISTAIALFVQNNGIIGEQAINWLFAASASSATSQTATDSHGARAGPRASRFLAILRISGHAVITTSGNSES
jgi:hypothetical protein